ncbi:MAG: peptidoglycan DD-metalloendopeptidase family protein [candidate division NC10 bacterium]|nr:peptidoglycan DD-metalloendopeptidase family protein [candidate division NC10 bacterium]
MSGVWLFLPTTAWDRGESPLQEKQEKLKELKNRIIKERERTKEVAEKEHSIAHQLAHIDEGLKRETAELRELEAKLTRSGERIRRLSREIVVVEGKLQGARTLLAKRLRALYKQGRLGGLRFLLASDGLTGTTTRLKYLMAVASQDKQLISGYTATVSELHKKREELERSKAEITRNQTLAGEKRQEILEEQRVRRLLLARVRQEKAGHMATLKELEEASQELQALIARLKTEETAARRRVLQGEGQTLDGSVFAALRGKLPWPTEGALTSTFGRKEHPRFRTVTFNKGIGIQAPEGRGIVAVHDATVLYADWFKGYGRLLILDHGGGYFTLYAHASELLVKTGDRVSRGQVIARVGDSGSLEGPQLYFELRYKGKPQDPLAWLLPR